MVTSPTLANQATQQESSIAINRPPELQRWFKPITGGPALFDMSPVEWKPWRAFFNPGFGGTNLLTHVPHMVEETLVYRDILTKHALEKNVFQLNNVTLRYTMDIIGRVVL